MDTGLLWLDDDPKRTLAQKVARAAAYYQEKHGQAPNMCFVHPLAVAVPTWLGAVHVAPLKTVLVNHLWLGVTDAAALPAPALETGA